MDAKMTIELWGDNFRLDFRLFGLAGASHRKRTVSSRQNVFGFNDSCQIGKGLR